MSEPVSRLSAALSDRYTIERELGAGGMATVYLAHDIKHDRDVAIKVLHPDLGAALGGERFLSEIRTTAKLQHPHILPLLDSGDADGLLYYVMPYITGETLRTRLERERQLPIADAVLIAREVADALGAAHALGIIHRDIKPENILLQGGHALVADFGIALAVQTAGGTRMTQTGLSLGTPQYMSPEQAMGEKVIDARSDIYALGAMSYEMLVGEAPFTGPSVQAIVARLITEEPRTIASQRKAVPEHVESAVMQALEKLPADRFANAAEFALALRGQQGSTTTARSPRGSTPSMARQRSMPAVRLATGIGLLALGTAIGWLLSGRTGGVATVADSPTITSILAPPGGSFRESRALALSPDGRQLAFVFAASDGSRMLWVRHLDRPDAEPVAQTTGADAPFWSPNGRTLGYFAGGFLTVVEPNGNPRRLCPVADPTGGSWSSKGVILFGDRRGLATVPASGGECRRIVTDSGGRTLKGLFLPDGNRLLYSRGRNLDMVVADLDGKQLGTLPVRAIEFAVVPPGYLITPSPTDVLGLEARRFNLASLALDSTAVRVASDVRAQGGRHTFSMSSNGALVFLPSVVDRPYLEYDANGSLHDTIRVEGTWTLSVRPQRAGPPFVAVAGNVVGIWLYDLSSGRGIRLRTQDSVASRGLGAGTTWPAFDLDGSHLAYLLSKPGYCRIMEHDLRSDVERTITRDSVASNSLCRTPLDWSPDGRLLLVRRDTVLQLLAADSGAVVQEIVRPGQLWDARLSPDGRAVAYSSDETGRAEVYLQSLPTGPAIRVSLEGARWPFWSHDGQRLTFLTPDGRVQEATLGTTAGAPTTTPRTKFAIPTWRRSTFDDRGTGFAVIGDGERYLVRVSPTGLAVVYMQNWPALLRRADAAAGQRVQP